MSLASRHPSITSHVTVLLAVLLATSLFAGAVAAQPSPSEVDADDTWEAGSQRWMDQHLVFYPDQPNASAAEAAGYDVYALDYEANQVIQESNLGLIFDETEDGTPYTLIRERSETGIGGDYVIAMNDSRAGQVWTDSSGQEVDRGDRGDEWARVQIREQEFDARFLDDDEDQIEAIESGETAYLELLTNRQNSHTAILDLEDESVTVLEDMLRDADTERESGGLGVELQGSQTLTAYFDDRASTAGTYTLTIEIPDTGISESLSITVTEPATATPTETSTATSTPTATATPAITTTSTPGGESGSADERRTVTETPGGETNGTGDSTAAAQGAENATATATDQAGASGVDEPESDAEGQSGFGVVALLMALIASMAVLRRREW